MQFFALALFAVSASASLVARQSPYPDCANSCLANANLGDCGSATNILCLCKTPAFVAGTTTCIESACQGADLQKAISVSQGICASVGVTLTSSQSSTGTPTSSSSGSSSTPTSPTSSSSSSSSSGTGSATGSAPTTSTSSAAAPARAVNGLVALGAAGLMALAL